MGWRYGEREIYGKITVTNGKGKGENGTAEMQRTKKEKALFGS